MQHTIQGEELGPPYLPGLWCWRLLLRSDQRRLARKQFYGDGADVDSLNLGRHEFKRTPIAFLRDDHMGQQQAAALQDAPDLVLLNRAIKWLSVARTNLRANHGPIWCSPVRPDAHLIP